MKTLKLQRSAADRESSGFLADSIVSVTRALARESGFAKVTMRQIALKLNVTATALYYHFSDKDALFERVAESIFEDLKVENPDQPWAEQLRAYVLAYQARLLEYPGLARILLANRESPAALIWTETMLSILRRAGFKDQKIWEALAMLVFFVNPMTLMEEKPVTARKLLHDPKTVRRTVLQSPGRYPTFAALLKQTGRGGEAVTLTYDGLLPTALDRIIASLTADLQADQTKT
jgi:AcrR family transcriptional regulator